MKILIWGTLTEGGPYDVFRQIDYRTIFRELNENFHASTTNVGNKVWIQGIISCLSSEENQIFFLDEKKSWAEINASYDCIVYSAANMLCEKYKDLLSEVAELFQNSKIPVYVIAIGAQAPSYDALHSVAGTIKKEAASFMKSIYMTGGEIACRGFFTKELLDSIMPNTAVVTGCPSLYQNGPSLSITPSGGIVKPIINGCLFSEKELFRNYPNCVFIDQSDWFAETYDYLHYKTKNSWSYLADIVRKHGLTDTELFIQERIKIFYDVTDWRRFLINNNFNFCIGSRIHGNIMAILSGIPALMIPVDSRTREMAEFYDIPILPKKTELPSLQSLYEAIDYGAFNRNYLGRYTDFNAFLKQHGLVKTIRPDNLFWGRSAPRNAETVSVELDKLQKKYKHIGKNIYVFLRAYAKLRKGKNSFLSVKETKETYNIEGCHKGASGLNDE